MFLENVDAPKDDIISSTDVLKFLRKRNCREEDIDLIKEFIGNNDVLDTSGFSGNTTLLVDGDESYCIKISDISSSLQDLKILSNFFNKYKYTSNVISYISTNKDYLITEKINANLVVQEFQDIDVVASTMGEYLRKFHDTVWDIQHFSDDERRLLRDNRDKFITTALKHDVGLSFFADYLCDHDFCSMKNYIEKYGYLFNPDEVLVHGDFNPKNIFSKDGKLCGIIDFTDSHFGDRHYDICFSMWSCMLYYGLLNYKEAIDRFIDIFLKSYGIEKIDFDRMKLCNKIVCMYWQENNVINYLRR